MPAWSVFVISTQEVFLLLQPSWGGQKLSCTFQQEAHGQPLIALSHVLGEVCNAYPPYILSHFLP